jgi:hypothetical protein
VVELRQEQAAENNAEAVVGAKTDRYLVVDPSSSQKGISAIIAIKSLGP